MIVQATSGFSPPAATRQSLSSRQDPSASPASPADDTVTISQAARETLAASGSGRASTDTYPLEFYSVPKWQGDLMPMVLSGKLGGVESVYERGGHLAGGDYAPEIAEYGKLFDGHLKAILQSKGITTTPEFHQAMIVDKESSENIRLLMMESIAGDNRMMQLMKTLGIPLPE